VPLTADSTPDQCAKHHGLRVIATSKARSIVRRLRACAMAVYNLHNERSASPSSSMPRGINDPCINVMYRFWRVAAVTMQLRCFDFRHRAANHAIMSFKAIDPPSQPLVVRYLVGSADTTITTPRPAFGRYQPRVGTSNWREEIGFKPKNSKYPSRP